VDERTALLQQLQAQRGHVLGILEGLTDEQLRRPVLPSAWSSLGLVRHLALDVERFWFRICVAGEQVELPTMAGAWEVPGDESPEDVVALYREEGRLADAIVRRTPLDAGPAYWPDFFGDLPPRDLRRTILHVLVETATHAGHLDAVRELIDGRTWLVLTD
jgi:hypothetical protein